MTSNNSHITDNVSLEDLDIHYHQYHSSSFPSLTVILAILSVSTIITVAALYTGHGKNRSKMKFFKGNVDGFSYFH